MEFKEYSELTLTDQYLRFQTYIQRSFSESRRKGGYLSSPYRGQGRILAMLNMQPTMTQKELSYLLDIRPQSLGELLSKLENSGLIVRTPNEKDRRVLNIHLTEEGRREAEKLNEDQDDLGFFAALDSEEKANLSKVMFKLISQIEKELPEESFGPQRGPRGFGRHRRDPRMGGRPERPDHFSEGGPFA